MTSRDDDVTGADVTAAAALTANDRATCNDESLSLSLAGFIFVRADYARLRTDWELRTGRIVAREQQATRFTQTNARAVSREVFVRKFGQFRDRKKSRRESKKFVGGKFAGLLSLDWQIIARFHAISRKWALCLRRISNSTERIADRKWWIRLSSCRRRSDLNCGRWLDFVIIYLRILLAYTNEPVVDCLYIYIERHYCSQQLCVQQCSYKL